MVLADFFDVVEIPRNPFSSLEHLLQQFPLPVMTVRRGRVPLQGRAPLYIDVGADLEFGIVSVGCVFLSFHFLRFGGGGGGETGPNHCCAKSVILFWNHRLEQHLIIFFVSIEFENKKIKPHFAVHRFAPTTWICCCLSGSLQLRPVSAGLARRAYSGERAEFRFPARCSGSM